MDDLQEKRKSRQRGNGAITIFLPIVIFYDDIEQITPSTYKADNLEAMVPAVSVKVKSGRINILASSPEQADLLTKELLECSGRKTKGEVVSLDERRQKETK